MKVCSFGLSTCVKTWQVSISEEESQNLSSQMLPPGLLVIHDASRGGQHHLAKLSGGQKVVRPLLNVVQGNVEPAFEVNLKIFKRVESHLGEMTPHLLSLPVRLTTILPARWSSTTCKSTIKFTT